MTFNAAAGTTYFIAVDSNPQDSGTFSLNWLPAVAPSNDLFANAQLIALSSGNVTGTNITASVENGEPEHASQAGGHSVWYRWQAPASGSAIFGTSATSNSCIPQEFNLDTLLAVYTGSAVNTLTLVAANDDRQPGVNLSSRVIFNAVS